jgi:hypothetical protein
MVKEDNIAEPEIKDLIKALNEHPSVVRTFREGNLFGMFTGALVLVGGFVMFFMGLAGTIDWIFESATIKSKLANASPGALFAVVGLIIMLKYKPRVKTEIEISVNKSYQRSNPDIVNSETKVRVSSTASSPITPPRGGRW